METLAFLRGGEAARKFDVTGAIRLLTMHREFMATERAAADNRSEQDVLDAIDATIDEMRERQAANAAAPKRRAATRKGLDDASAQAKPR